MKIIPLKLITLTALITAPTAYGAILAVDFNLDNGDTATGFQPMSTTAATTFGDITVEVTNSVGIWGRGSNGSDIQDLYSDFAYRNDANAWQIILSGVGIAADTEYSLTFWSFDSADNYTADIAAASGTTGTTLSITDDSTAYPSDFTAFRETGTFTSDATGTLTFDISAAVGNRSRINGFELAAVPEPSTALFIGFAGLSLLLRRRRS